VYRLKFGLSASPGAETPWTIAASKRRPLGFIEPCVPAIAHKLASDRSKLEATQSVAQPYVFAI
jgi:hypothetical protein